MKVSFIDNNSNQLQENNFKEISNVNQVNQLFNFKENMKLNDQNYNNFEKDIIKNDHIKYDKNSKCYFITLDSELVKAFSTLLKLSTYNKYLSINSVMDFYIMQIIVLEYDVRYNLAIKENFESEFKLMNENLFLKEEEINFLKNRLSTLEAGENTEDIFYQEINKIRDLLREKTSEMIKLEHFHNQSNNEIKDKFNQLKDQNNMLVSENDKLKEILKDILNFHTNGQKIELENLLNFINNNNTLELINQNINVEKKENNYINNNNMNNKNNNIQEDSDLKNLSSSISNNINNQKEDFTEKVLNEFDKIFHDELKRVERYFNKNNNPNNKNIDISKKKNSLNRKNSAEKNYYEWKPKKLNDAWAETLRGKDNFKNNSQNNFYQNPNYNCNPNKNLYNNLNNHQNNNIDLDDLIEQSKNKIRNSLKSYENLHINVNTNNTNMNSNAINIINSNTTKNATYHNNNTNNFLSGKENNLGINFNYSSKNLNNLQIKEQVMNFNNTNNLNMHAKNNSNSNIISQISNRLRSNQSQSPTLRNENMRHSSSKKEVKTRE